MNSQRSIVAASLGATHHPDVYVRRNLVPGAERTAGNDDRVATRVQARGAQELGRDQWLPGPSPHPIPNCPRLA